MRTCTSTGRSSLASAYRNASSRISCVSRPTAARKGHWNPPRTTATRAAQISTTSVAPASKSTSTMSTPITMYSYPLAFNPAKALLAIEEKKLNVRVQTVDLFGGESLKPWFMKITPASTVPVVVSGGRTITQTRDVLAFFDEIGTPLGGDRVDRALVTELVDKLNAWDGNLYAEANIPDPGKKLLGKLTTYREKVAQAQQQKADKAGDTQLASAYKDKIATMQKGKASARDPAAVEANKQELTQLLDRAEGLLANNPYVAGQEFSMADVVLTTILFRTSIVGQLKQWLQPRPKLSAYYNRMKERPSYKKVMGTATSPFTGASLMLPALVKATVASVTGWYA